MIAVDFTPMRNATCRVAMQERKQGIWLSIFPDRENTANLDNTGKWIIFQFQCNVAAMYF